MQIVIDIPEEEFGIDINDKFKDFFQRLRAEIKERLISGTSLVCGAYELEIIDMFLKAFNNGTQLPEKPVSCKFIERNGNVAPYLIVATNDIKALEQEPCDCISRKQALNDFAAWYGFGYSYNTFYEHLKNMPSIQPKTDVLDKMRAEIDSCCSDNRDRNDGLYIAMQIIDKYKTESEVD